MKDVVIIGAGVIGLCSAYYAAQRGFRVTVIDRAAEDTTAVPTATPA